MCVIWLIHVCDMTHSCVWYDSFMCVTWLISVCDITYLYVWHDPFIRVLYLIPECDTTYLYVWHDWFVCATWLIHVCDVTHSCVWRDALICVTCLIGMCDVPHWYVWRDSLTCVTRLIDMCDVTHWYVWHDSRLMRRAWCSMQVWYSSNHTTHQKIMAHESCFIYEWVISHIRMSHGAACGCRTPRKLIPYVLQCVAVCCHVLPHVAVRCHVLPCVAVCCKVFQSVAECCRVLQSIAECCRVLQSVALTHAVGMSLQMDTILIALPLLWPLHSLDKFCVTWLIHACGSLKCAWFDSSIWWLIQRCVTSLQTVAIAWWILCDVTSSHAWLIQMCATWVIHLCDWFECAWMCSVGVEWLLLVLNVFQNCCGICSTVVEHFHTRTSVVFVCLRALMCLFVRLYVCKYKCVCIYEIYKNDRRKIFQGAAKVHVFPTPPYSVDICTNQKHTFCGTERETVWVCTPE